MRLSIPVVTARVFFEAAQKASIEPAAIAGVHDGVVVAGKTGSQAWAGKIDSQGQLPWTYRVDAQAGSDCSPLSRHSSPAFHCAAAMADGTVWLAGQAVGPGYIAGLVAHLDARGNTLFEAVLHPPGESRTPPFPAHLTDCMSWGDGGVAIIGWTSTQSPASARAAAGEGSSGGSPRPQLAYWLVGFDAAGRKILDAVIATNQAGIVRGMSILAVEPQLVISATTNSHTEILSLTSSGIVRARKQYPHGFLRLVRPVQTDDQIQLWGTFWSVPDAVAGPSVLLTLDGELHELQRQQAPRALAVGLAYRMPDRSLVLFGSEPHAVGERCTSQLMHVDATLGRTQILNPERSEFTDTGAILAAAPHGKTGRFAMASPAVVQGFPRRPWRIEHFPGFQRGAVLEFVELR